MLHAVSFNFQYLKSEWTENEITVVVADIQETDFGHKLHTGFGVGDPVVQEVASGKLEVVDIDSHLVKVVEGRTEVHRLAEYVQDKYAEIQGDGEDTTEVALVDHLEEVARKSES
jgi:hypothetical protein